MNKMLRLLALFFLLLVVTATVHARDTLRCKGKLVSTGMTIEEIRNYCGEPQSRRVEERPVRSGNRVTGTYQAEIWTYQRGSGQNPAVLEFHDGELKSLEYVRD
jgi:hypothetical protein